MVPLAERLRPLSPEDFVGQNHLFGEGKPLQKVLETQKIHSMILWGPPGVGKTTFANILAEISDRTFFSLSAVDSGIKGVREALQKGKELITLHQKAPILFLDEIHRFSKSQQDSLLGGVEKGIIALIGATTENPSFEINNALLSRCRVYRFEELGSADLQLLIQRALKKDDYLSELDIQIKETDELLRYSAGDVRKLYNALESIVELNDPKAGKPITISNESVNQLMEMNADSYDRKGDYHYDLISAFIKSIRGGDPDAALYWMFRMIEGGEDIKFICRRMIISASEDIGLANPNALLLANSCFQAATIIGLPEAEIPMSQTAVYLATSPKSNTAYLAMHKAKKAAKDHFSAKVPLHLRNAPTKLTRELGFGKGYLYPHDYPGNFVAQSYLPEEVEIKTFYTPGNNAHEARIKEKLDKQKNLEKKNN